MNSVKQAVNNLEKKLDTFPQTLVTLGSGWKKVLAETKVIEEMSYQELFGVEASVPGHEGKLIIGQVEGKEVAFMSGRFHMYEGYSGEEVTRPLQVFAKVGLENVVLTAASGAINEKYQVGDFVLLSDLLTLFLSLDNPLKGPKFQDLSQIFDQAWRQQAKKVMTNHQIKFQEGIYAYYHGPNYETPADKMAFKILGADVVGMSTVPEAIMAKHLGLNVLGFAFVTNLAFVEHDHKEVVAQAEKAGDKMSLLIKKLIR
jgi:purine-nucleoside phosphorylase